MEKFWGSVPYVDKALTIEDETYLPRTKRETISDPTYITSFNNARNLLTKIERDEILEELVKSYIKNM